ncbi:IS110 family transposase, partial [Planococcus kocurii]|uniref:IS110 family transposase n=1 Tax=Planococcus kocurii TaxID=1374 RepID=UPI003CFDE475
AMICNVYGDILVKPFEFNAASAGFEKLVKEIKQAREGYGFEEVVVGIETTGHYYEDLVRLCEQEKFIVRIINAATTAKERETVLNYTKTDNVDLMAITQSLLHGRGKPSQEALPLLEQLKTLSRAHRTLIDARSRTVNHIRLYMDHIFREFQGVVETGHLKDFLDFRLQVITLLDASLSTSFGYLGIRGRGIAPAFD